MADRIDNPLARHFARLLLDRSPLGGEEGKRFRDLVEALSEAVGQGHSCLPVAEDDAALLQRSGLVSRETAAPLVLYDGRLSLQRYFHYEARLARQLAAFAARERPLSVPEEIYATVFGSDESDADRQRQAAALAVKKHLAIVSGGPGTGKTSTVVRILAILLQALPQRFDVVLAAPTGKAAVRLQQSVRTAIERLAVGEEVRRRLPTEAMTLHRLLGVRRHSPQFRHRADNPLLHDLVVVDEASMVDLALMSKLVDALTPQSALILLGDKDQLASVEAGSVLADLVASLPENTVVLEKSYRFDRAIGGLAEAVNRADEVAAWDILQSGEFANIQVLPPSRTDLLCHGYDDYLRTVQASGPGEYALLFEALNSFRVLCALRGGRLGVDGLNGRIERHLQRSFGCRGQWYAGRPVLIVRNDYSLRLYNGDVGICLADPEDGLMKVYFEAEDGAGLRSFLPHRLPEHQTAYAMTIHKSQGSEFGRVAVVLPAEDSLLLSRELIYTAVTRSRGQLLLCGSREVFSAALARKTRRFSNLRGLLGRGQAAPS